MKLASFPMKALAASLMLVSMTGLAFAKNYKGENYKGEAMPAPCPAPRMLMDGVYLGAQVGYDSYRVRTSIDSPAVASTFVANPVLNATGWVGGLMLGYGKYINDWFYLAGEIFGNVSGAETSFSAATATETVNGKFEANGSWGIALLPGARLNDTSLGYVRLGWNWANLKANASSTVAGVTTSGSKTNTSNGFVFGVGIETLLWDNWSLRGEFDHTYYNSFNTTVATINPSDNQFMLGLLYHFA